MSRLRSPDDGGNVGGEGGGSGLTGITLVMRVSIGTLISLVCMLSILAGLAAAGGVYLLVPDSLAASVFFGVLTFGVILTTMVDIFEDCDPDNHDYEDGEE